MRRVSIGEGFGAKWLERRAGVGGCLTAHKLNPKSPTRATHLNTMHP